LRQERNLIHFDLSFNLLLRFDLSFTLLRHSTHWELHPLAIPLPMLTYELQQISCFVRELFFCVYPLQ
jgi:hypothetical protein